MPQQLVDDHLPMGDALKIALVGLAIGFLVLISLMCFVVLIRLIVGKLEGTKTEIGNDENQGRQAETQALPPKNQDEPGKMPAPGSVGEMNLHSVDDKTAALLMAIVADEMGAPLNELRFTSIREIQSAKDKEAGKQPRR